MPTRITLYKTGLIALLLSQMLFSFFFPTCAIARKDSIELGRKTPFQWHKTMVFFSWGYNWTKFSNTDVTINLPDGCYTIHEVQAYDRPSTELKTYFDLPNWSIPQYNVSIGFLVPMANERTRIGLAIEQDHMKWVADFSGNIPYKISGFYTKNVYIKTADGNQQRVDFEYVKQHGDMTFVRMYEHTNGYNFPHLSLVADHQLFGKVSNRLKCTFSAGIGLGMMVPKTEFNQQVDSAGVPVRVGIDNPFHVAGWGVGIQMGLGLTYQPRNSRFSWSLLNQQKIGFSRLSQALLNGKGSGTASDTGVWWWQNIPLRLTIQFGLRRVKK